MVIVHCLDQAPKLHVPPFKLAQLSKEQQEQTKKDYRRPSSFPSLLRSLRAKEPTASRVTRYNRDK